MKFKDLPIGADFTNYYWDQKKVFFTKIAQLDYTLDENRGKKDIRWNAKFSPLNANLDGLLDRYASPNGEVILVEDCIP